MPSDPVITINFFSYRCGDTQHVTAECRFAHRVFCNFCRGNHHRRFCPNKPCDRCESSDHVTQNCPERCSLCGGKHSSDACKCQICNGNGHTRKNCPMFDKFTVCSVCHGKHRMNDCQMRPCKLCQKLGHTHYACPLINEHTICKNCGENHHVHFCPKTGCKRFYSPSLVYTILESCDHLSNGSSKSVSFQFRYGKSVLMPSQPMS